MTICALLRQRNQRSIVRSYSRVAPDLPAPEYNPEGTAARMVSLAKAAEQLGICVGSDLSDQRHHPTAIQAMKGAQWLVLVEALTSEAVQIEVQRVVERRPKVYEHYRIR